MKQIKTEQIYTVFERLEDLSAQDQLLLQKAKAALDDSYSPYSNFKVGAAILLQNGELLTGSNQENASYPLCLCAERVAIAAADAQFPRVPIVAIAVTARSAIKPVAQPISPCGACRQVLCETETKHQQTMRILLQGETGDIIVVEKAKDLLPFAFDGTFL